MYNELQWEKYLNAWNIKIFKNIQKYSKILKKYKKCSKILKKLKKI